MHRSDGEPYPLTEAQAGLWYAQRLDPDNPAFNTAHALWIEGDLDVAAFARAADRAAAEAEALALRMDDSEAVPRQWVDDACRPAIERVDLSTRDDPDAVAREIMRGDRLTPIDPTRERLARQCLLMLGPKRFVWYLRVHHFATDGYGMALFGERVAELYASTEGGAPLAPLAQVLDEDAAYRQSERRGRDAAYWRETMAEAPPPTGLEAGPETAADDCRRLIRPIDTTLREGLLALAESLGQPWPDVLTALTAEYCRRHADAAETVIGVPCMGRLGSASARVPASSSAAVVTVAIAASSCAATSAGSVPGGACTGRWSTCSRFTGRCAWRGCEPAWRSSAPARSTT
ncbi:condensation domain-containing protein [Chromohalobacter canadensis]|uniref:condensation domain-containing protein n=1 Tax=Chromohalobacter canadensis TaxID=141389 RepID=UPI0024104947|nr:condensation domain-containing protein [Chromohalobacter canadensis]